MGSVLKSEMKADTRKADYKPARRRRRKKKSRNLINSDKSDTIFAYFGIVRRSQSTIENKTEIWAICKWIV